MTPNVKSCCAMVYESELARVLLGNSFHPGGLALTKRLGELLGLRAGLRILDVASGTGESAIFLAKMFACEVVGIDLSEKNCELATAHASQIQMGTAVRFLRGDAEELPFTRCFDAIICECAFCTFPDKNAAIREFSRVLKPNGRLGLSDVTLSSALPRELMGLLAWIACIADACPAIEYARYLSSAGLREITIESHSEALIEMLHTVQGKLFGVELIKKMNPAVLESLNLAEAKLVANALASAVRAGTVGYAILTATR